MTADPFKDHAETTGDPVRNALQIVPDDDNDLSILPRALVALQTGEMRATFQNGEIVTVQIHAGMIYPYRVTRIHATGTTASGFAILW